MDGNKDDSEKCIRIVERLFIEKDFVKALKFAQKADQLYPTTKTKGKYFVTFAIYSFVFSFFFRCRIVGPSPSTLLK